MILKKSFEFWFYADPYSRTYRQLYMLRKKGRIIFYPEINPKNPKLIN